MPLTWAVLLLRGTFVKGVGFSALIPDLLALTLFALVIFGVAVMATRRRLSE
jgi:ABC-2 type transport system permease protein